ncbi:ankyrin repeats (3 copies) domain-containing protein [Purpureocillium lilacinum]|uniref:Ankyrin repeats (3 copies) domain-containing protein n=1 Tax=Purpureocillium lilacinum TaxID=33203 RepID=A0A179GQA7_PURLI|nr:ankyrin repeats (3 copies) domain-containing protein [Purpureocillium lilacinum]
MRLLELCPEIIVQIGESVDSEQDLLALSRAHPALSTLLTRCLYRLDAEAYGGSELYRAAKRGSLAGVKASLKYGASRYLDDFRLRDSNNDDAEYLGYYKMMTPLMMAAAGGNLEVAQLLLGEGASVEPDLHWSMEGFHQSALHIAMDRGDVRMIRLLVDAGANVEPSATDPRFGPGARRRGPLGRAMEREQEEIAMILLDAGASPQRYTLRGDSMLHIALQMRSMGLVTRLLEKGASPNDSGWLDLSLVKVAVQLESPELLKLLLTHGASSEPSGSWDSMICDAWDCAKVALEGRKYEVFEWLLKYGIVADTRGTKAEDVLVLAIQWDMPDYIRALIELGARLGAREIGEPTLLMILAKAGYFEATQILLSLEAEPESTDMDGRTALFLAVKSMAEMDHVFQTVTILLDAGADPNVVDGRRWIGVQTTTMKSKNF